MAALPFILPEALEDLAEICAWYQRKLHDLELRFQADFDRSLAQILLDPTIHAADEVGLRRISMGTFPYHIGYLIERDLVVIVGVIHTSRHPGVWKARV
ncbi:MAG: type II toxin-antitoxin system RelE/ParE family toxin [Planctomycetes bacterium]|nr:type II toxin-antitoxin system RelE/ParE family toxin [Planctomycetota bacterium]